MERRIAGNTVENSVTNRDDLNFFLGNALDIVVRMLDVEISPRTLHIWMSMRNRQCNKSENGRKHCENPDQRFHKD